MDGNESEAARAYCAGEVGFERFERDTAEALGRWSRTTMRRWRGSTPPWFGEEDLRQELLIAAWEYAGKFEPARYPDAWRSVHWVATKCAKKKLNRAREVNQHTRSGPARFAVATEFNDANSPESREAAQDEALARATRYEVLRAVCTTRAQRAVVDALAATDGTTEAAATYLYADPRSRLTCRLGNEAQAAAVVGRVVERLILDFGIEEAR